MSDTTISIRYNFGTREIVMRLGNKDISHLVKSVEAPKLIIIFKNGWRTAFKQDDSANVFDFKSAIDSKAADEIVAAANARKAEDYLNFKKVKK